MNEIDKSSHCWTNRNIVWVVTDIEPQVEYSTSRAKVLERNQVAMIVDTLKEMGCAGFWKLIYFTKSINYKKRRLYYFL